MTGGMKCDKFRDIKDQIRLDRLQRFSDSRSDPESKSRRVSESNNVGVKDLPTTEKHVVPEDLQKTSQRFFIGSIG